MEGIFFVRGELYKIFCVCKLGGVFLGEAASLLLRGWSVPVGGSTPDRRCCRPALHNSHSPNGIPQAAFDISGFGIAERHSAGVERSVLVPVGGSTPDRLKGRPALLDPCFQIRKGIAAINLSNCFLLSVALLSRGWIVPVGGATPDRLKDQGRRKEAALGRAGLVFSEFPHSGFRQSFLGGANLLRVFAAELRKPIADVVIQNFAEEFDVTLRGV